MSRINQISHIDTYLSKIYYNIVLPSTIRPSIGLVTIGSPVNILKALLPSSILPRFPANFIDLITILLYQVNKIHCSESFSFLSIFSFSIMFSNSCSLFSSRNIMDLVSQSYITSGNIIVLYILIFKFLESCREDKSAWTE